MSDMRNVNNWHWVSKDCRPWAKKYLTEQLVDLSTKKDNVNAKITSLDECNGDVDLNQRKGKLFAIYDLVLKFSWEASQHDKRAFGTISVPEFAYDTEEYVFKCTVNQSSEFDLKAKQVVQSLLIPLMKERLAKFASELIDSYSADLYVNSSNKKEPAQNKSSVSLQPIRSCEDKDTVVKTTVVNHSFEFKGGDAKQIYEALLDPKRAVIWTRTSKSLKLSKQAGSTFELFDGNVQGVLLDLMPNKQIRQTWRLKSWPKGHFSTVTINLLNSQEGVTIHVNQTGVPASEEGSIERNWMGYYWQSIQAHYPQLSSMPIEREHSFVRYQYYTLIVCFIILALSIVISFSTTIKL
ncbi:hypothetical protein BCV72DRAFT_19935 [Rhizopus microsporus var. microsporus]|uniref:Activator of Hsp90 ATPase AHSA1-like N-terminal domain-containing protein n=1 Tax=Rhizopus microsporus var. microsporus TaxID=86635 RepID=A0A1X0QWI9_RHIZD|nr:hypothetical protein BCV72DRAFT_19935 [Rhizopus microsporus var. microsporus]